MYYIGIDIAKQIHYASVMDSNGEILVEPFAFHCNQNGFEKFISKVKSYVSKQHVIGLESTGHYGDTLALYLLDRQYTVGIINPIVTDAARKLRIRKAKNDKIDCMLICSVLMDKSNYTNFTKSKIALRKMKQITRLRASSMETLNQYKNRLQACIDLVFPEFNTLFKTKYTKAYMAVLSQYGGSYEISNAHLTKLANLLKSTGRGRLKLSATDLKQAAKTSVGEHNEILTIEIKLLIQNIELIQSQISLMDEKIKEFALKSNSPIYSIPGIGFITGTVILSEISDIHLFTSAKKLVGFAGVDPAVYQSGTYNAVGTAISKRGSPYLRKALYQVALTVTNFNPTFNQYYTRKRKEGKSHRCAQGHVIRKLIRVIFKLLTENNAFDATALI